MTDADLRAGLSQLRGEWGVLSESYPEMIAGLVAGGRVASAFRFIESIRAREITEADTPPHRAVNDSSDRARRIPACVGAARGDHARRRAPAHAARRGARRVDTRRRRRADDRDRRDERQGDRRVAPGDATYVAPLIDRYLRVATAGGEPVAVGRQLGAALLDPIVRALPARVTRLQISPDGDLFRVPFDALRMADDRYAVERFAISLVPSATAARAFEAIPSRRGERRLLAVGDPAFRVGARCSTRCGTRLAGDTSALRQRVAGAAAALGGRGAPRRRVRDDRARADPRRRDGGGGAWRRLARVGVAHFATHALVDVEGQARTALALSPGGTDDGFLATSEIASLAPQRSARRALGVRIARRADPGRRRPPRLDRSIVRGGARAVVVTHWSIGDGSVLPFIDRFYAAMAGGLIGGRRAPPSEAHCDQGRRARRRLGGVHGDRRRVDARGAACPPPRPVVSERRRATSPAGRRAAASPR